MRTKITSMLSSVAIVVAMSAGPAGAVTQVPAAGTTGSDLRIGVLALANAIAAVGRTPELATPLPYTRTSPAQALDLDNVLSSELTTALNGTSLTTALSKVPGIKDVRATQDGNRIEFGYAKTATVDLPLVHDDGSLRFASKASAGSMRVSLATTGGSTFVVQVDPAQTDPLLKVALVSRPTMALTVHVTRAATAPTLKAREGFTDVNVSVDRYAVARTDTIAMRDPDGRSELTLEDLRYSTLPDLFSIKRDSDNVDIGLGVSLPSGLAITGTGAGTGADSGTLVLTTPPSTGVVWPDDTKPARTYGAALTALTGLTQVDGVTALAKYTGASLALQDAAGVEFPNLGGGTGDLFAPGDDLLAMLSTAATAQIRCGLAAGNPPTGTPAPGDTVFCDAVTPASLGSVSNIKWTVNGGNGSLSGGSTTSGSVGTDPASTVQVDGSDGEPDLTVTFTAGGKDFTAGTLPHTVQQVLSRIRKLGDTGTGGTTATASLDLTAQRLDVAVDLRRATATKDLALGNPGTLGALVGLTGLSAQGKSGSAKATATNGRYDVGFGISTGAVSSGKERATVLLPGSATLLSVGGVSASTPAGLTGLDARVGFLGVSADVTGLSLGTTGSDPAVALGRSDGKTTEPIGLDAVLNETGGVKNGVLRLAQTIKGGISLSATEKALPGGGFATGGTAAKSGTVSVSWTPSGTPSVSAGSGYNDLRVFDPVPARFLHGTAHVNGSTVSVDVPAVDGKNLYQQLGVAAVAGSSVTRKLVGPGVGCQGVTLTDGGTLTCEGLAPNGTAAFTDGQVVDLVVLGDPFAMRDGVIDGLTSALGQFDALDGDHRATPKPAADQYRSTLPLVDITPAQASYALDDLRTGLGNLTASAARDQQTKAKVPAATDLPVSSVQEMTTALRTSAFLPDGTLATFTLGPDKHLLVSVAAQKSDTPKLPLRVDDAGLGQVVSKGTFTVPITSATTLAVDVDPVTGRPKIGTGTGTLTHATLDIGSELNSANVRAGVGDATLASSGSTAKLGVDVSTAYDGSNLVTTRSVATSAPSGLPSGKAAVVDLKTGSQTIRVELGPEDTSGGSGTPPAAPEAMQVKYLAEGLDGLATALGSSLDGAAVRNHPGTDAPVSAPLIGTDLSAGSDVTGTLTTLTSRLRDSLGAVTAAKPADLETAVQKAVTDAIAATADISKDGDVLAHVTCASTCAADADSKAWKQVSVTFALKSKDVTKKLPFDIGLAGVNVTSDKLVTTTTHWTLPVELRLTRGVGPEVYVDPHKKFELHTQASLPTDNPDCTGPCLKAVVGYLPALLTPQGDAADAAVNVGIGVTPQGDAKPYSLFDLYDGQLTALPSFLAATADEKAEDGLKLTFETTAKAAGGFDLKGKIGVPWTPDTTFGDVTYDDVAVNVGQVVHALTKPFQVVDPYLGPVRDVINVLRTPLPVVSDLSELAGGDEISLLSMLKKITGDQPEGSKKQTLELVTRVIEFTDFATKLSGSIASWPDSKFVPLESIAGTGELLSLAPSDVELASSCKETIRTAPKLPANGAPTTHQPTKKTQPCPDEDAEEQKQPGAKDQSTAETRKGKRATLKDSVATTTKSIVGQAPGFSIPFLSDPNQILDLVTGQGEATYFRIDFGSLVAGVSYNQSFGPIMAGPIPIKPFVGGSISVEGRLAVGFDSLPQTLAVQNLNHPGNVDALEKAFQNSNGNDIITKGFYLDDLDDDGIDVPEVKLVTTLEAGAGVSIGIVTAGLKGGVTLTIGLDLNDPNGDGKLRTAEISDYFKGSISCVFTAHADISAFIAVFVEIDLLLTTESWEYNLLELGPYTIFDTSGACPPEDPELVHWVGESGGVPAHLELTSGPDWTTRKQPSGDLSDHYEVRQFDTGGGASGGGTTTYEVTAYNRVQRVSVTKSGGSYALTIFKPGLALSTDVESTATSTSPVAFRADGGEQDDILKFLTGETFDDAGKLVSSPFTAPVTVSGGSGDDVLATGAGDDVVNGDGGNDSIDTGLGNDLVHGGDGVDVVSAGAGNDDVYGDANGDRLSGGPGADRVNGGAGNDSVVGGPGRDVRAVLPVNVTAPADSTDTTPSNLLRPQILAGFDSGDVLIGGDGSDSVDGGDGSDVVVGGSAPSLATASLDSVIDPDGSRTVNALFTSATNPVDWSVSKVPTAVTPRPETLDTLCTSGTSDTSSSGTDFVTGGGENDVVIGSDGRDDLDGGAGRDELCGRNGDDHLAGDGAATPSVNPADDSDVMRGGLGDDRIEAGPGNDVAFGDDVNLYRNGARVLDGSLGSDSAGAGKDYLDGGDGHDVLSGGAGSDQVLGGAGDDVTSGEGTDTAATGSDGGSVADRLVDCNASTRVVGGYVDINSDLAAGPDAPTGVARDDGRIAGLAVDNGVVDGPGSSSPLTGLVAGDTVVINGLVDVNHDGKVDKHDTGSIPLASMAKVNGTTNANGDCILAGDGSDQLRGGKGSDFLGGGDGTDLADGGDGYDLELGDAGTDVLLGGAQDDVLVGGDGDDEMLGQAGDDRLRGNEGTDVLVGGSETSGATDGQDVLLGGRGDDALVAENGRVVSSTVYDQVKDAPWKGATGVPASALQGPSSTDRFADAATVCGSTDSPTPSVWVTLLKGKADEVRTPVPSPGTDQAYYDELYGGYGCDWVFGSAGDDLVRGGQDDDVVEGGPGTDTAYGDHGNDVVIGGSSEDRGSDVNITTTRSGAGQSDGNDTIYGDGGPDGEVGDDLIAGDDATPVRGILGSGRAGQVLPATAPSRWNLTLWDVPMPGSNPAAGPSGDDTIFGGDTGGGTGLSTTTTSSTGDLDRIYGQSGNDTVNAGSGTDYVEGNAGNDVLAGGAGDDVLVGGSTGADGSTGPQDGADQVYGDASPERSVGSDLIAGDNATASRRTNGTWWVQLAPTSDTTSAGDSLFGSDLMASSGNTGNVDTDRIFGQGGNDGVSAGTGDDYVEGNQGADTVSAGTGNDDVVGGSSSAAGQPLGSASTTGTRLDKAVDDWDTSAAGVADGIDTVHGDGGDDVVLGDNGRITRPAAPAGAWGTYRDVAMADKVATNVAGSDKLYGDDGDDVLYGQLDGGTATALGSGDYLSGGAGNDSLLGDLGVVTPTTADKLGKPTTLTSNSGTITEAVYPAGSVVPVTSVPTTMAGLGGADTLVGDAGSDSLRGGAGNDLAQGGDGDDAVLGGLGDDALWGGLGHDRIFGGYGDDDIDLKQRAGYPSAYWDVAGVSTKEDTDNKVSTTNGADIVYGGWGVDEMQADQGGAGRQPGSDQLIDWVGNHNLYYVCDGPYGAGRVLRNSSPDTEGLLGALITALGDTDVATSGSGGFSDLGLVANKDNNDNSKPAPGAPGNFTCEGPG